MTAKRRLRDTATEAHAASVRHDARCETCRYASRYGVRWQSHMCGTGLALFYAAKVATETAERKEG